MALLRLWTGQEPDRSNGPFASEETGKAEFCRGHYFWHARALPSAMARRSSLLDGHAWPSIPGLAPVPAPSHCYTHTGRPPVSTYRIRGYLSGSALLACLRCALVSRLHRIPASGLSHFVFRIKPTLNQNCRTAIPQQLMLTTLRSEAQL